MFFYSQHPLTDIWSIKSRKSHQFFVRHHNISLFVQETPDLVQFATLHNSKAVYQHSVIKVTDFLTRTEAEKKTEKSTTISEENRNQKNE